MSSKDISNQKFIRIKGYEYKVYPCGTIVDLQKASASLGNILESKELVSRYHPEVLKLSILLKSSKDSKELTAGCFTVKLSKFLQAPVFFFS